MMKIARGDIWVANLDPTVGKEIQKTRPVVVVSNNVANEFLGTVTVVPVTSQKLSKIYPFEAIIPDGTPGLAKASKAKADQIRTIDKSRLSQKLASLDAETIAEIDKAIKTHLDLH